ncbi:MAG: LysM peptidoglycan-binding domain-containing protein [Anaerolineae bacterium]|nr:LysM peptidoglycan-binding domain-containing protein [Anaerolineae bacterium]MDW8297715.1 LysM peptidoglycan-binding domain-containing protein [Anaerolineae bacterium]
MRTRLLSLFSLLLCFALSSFPPVYAQDGSDKPPTGMTIHVVQRGETLFRIAQRYGTTVEDLVRLNGIRNPAALAVGQRLLVPSPPVPEQVSIGIPTQYTLQFGDTLFKLAAAFGTTEAAIAQRNYITNPRQMYIGQRIVLQEGSESAQGIKTGWIHRVQHGETLYHIAARYSTSANLIRLVNRLRRADLLYVGQPLIVPSDENGVPLTDLPVPLARFEMTPAEQGRTSALRIVTLQPTRLEITFMGKSVTVFSDESQTLHTALIGVQALAEPNIYPLRMVAALTNGAQRTFEWRVYVADGGYRSEAITLSARQLDLLNPAITQPEEERVRQAVSAITPRRYFSGLMGLPCAAPVTSPFGTRRSYNGGALNTIHAGTDFAALPGAAVYAPAAGVVVLAETLTVRGNAIIIDHGWGIFTGYWHLETLNVRPGALVQAGDVIGTVGSSGRSTGPHLHWELFVQGVQVDPLQWTRQSFP